MISKNNELLFPLLLSLFTFFIWAGVLNLGFFNDDFQILEYLQQNYSENPLKVFTSQDISSYYFRPIPNLWNTLILNLFGFNPFFFRLSNLILYIVFVLLLYFFLSKLINNNTIVLLFALLFSVLPSHDIFLVWTAGVGDLFASIFVLLTFLLILFTSNRWGFIFSSLALIFAFLSKESTFPAILLLFASGLIFKEKSKQMFLLGIMGSLFLAILLIYREVILGIHLFASPNVENFTFLSLLFNFFKYIPIISIPTFAYSKENPVGLLLNFIFSMILLVFLVLWAKNKESRNYKLLVFGVCWYILFVLPALPLFMRWYSLLPSLGLVIASSELIRNARRFLIFLALIPLILILSSVDIYSLRTWNKTTKFCVKILNETKKIDPKGRSKILLWFFPQYRMNSPVLRSGIQQAINFHRQDKFTEVLLPVSIVYYPKSKVRLFESQARKFKFYVENAHPFLSNRNEQIFDSTSVENDYYHLKLLKISNKAYQIVVEFIQTKPDYVNYYFDGEEFRFFY